MEKTNKCDSREWQLNVLVQVIVFIEWNIDQSINGDLGINLRIQRNLFKSCKDDILAQKDAILGTM